MSRTFQDQTITEIFEYFQYAHNWQAVEETTVDDWPQGRNRVQMYFWVQKNGRGERINRQQPGRKPKQTVYYSRAVVVVDHNDEILIVGLTEAGQMVIQWGNLKYPQYLYYRPDAIEDAQKEENDVWKRCAQLLEIRYYGDMRIPPMETPGNVS